MIKFLSKIFLIFFINIIILICISKINVNCYYIPQGKQIKNSNQKTNDITNFAIGSCYGHWTIRREDIFKTILKLDPEMFVWTGDVAYVDNIVISVINQFIATDEFDKEFALQQYSKTYNNEYYKIFREKKPVVGIWDDHDYGLNNSNKYFKYKETTKKIFLDFVEEPKNSIRRTPDKPIYASYSFGSGYKTFKIILLDVRYSKTNENDENADMLGEDQWKWFENELKIGDETFTFIVSGTNILAPRIIPEVWFMPSRRRLFDLIGKYKKSGVILSSGDVHFGEIMKTFCIHPSKFL